MLLLDENLVIKLFTKQILNPRLYGLLKLHKSENFAKIPIGPFVSFVGSQLLNYKLINIYNNRFVFAVKYNLRVVEIINNIQLSNEYILISCDATNLFLNIPASEVLQVIKNYLIHINMPQK